MSNKSKLTRKINLRDVGQVVEAVILHGGDVIVHEEEPGQTRAGVRQPGGGDGLQVVVGQREDGEAADQSQGVIMITDQSELTWTGRRGRRGRG